MLRFRPRKPGSPPGASAMFGPPRGGVELSTHHLSPVQGVWKVCTSSPHLWITCGAIVGNAFERVCVRIEEDLKGGPRWTTTNDERCWRTHAPSFVTRARSSPL